VNPIHLRDGVACTPRPKPVAGRLPGPESGAALALAAAAAAQQRCAPGGLFWLQAIENRSPVASMPDLIAALAPPSTAAGGAGLLGRLVEGRLQGSARAAGCNRSSTAVPPWRPACARALAADGSGGRPGCCPCARSSSAIRRLCGLSKLAAAVRSRLRGASRRCPLRAGCRTLQAGPLPCRCAPCLAPAGLRVAAFPGRPCAGSDGPACPKPRRCARAWRPQPEPSVQTAPATPACGLAGQFPLVLVRARPQWLG